MSRPSLSLDRKLRKLASRLSPIAEDWAEPANGREPNFSAVVSGVSELRRIANEASDALIQFMHDSGMGKLKG